MSVAQPQQREAGSHHGLELAVLAVPIALICPSTVTVPPVCVHASVEVAPAPGTVEARLIGKTT